MADVRERFWSKVQITPACWIWTAGKDSSGYGSFKISGRKCGAHRVAYELTVGPVPQWVELDHTCRNRACVNPAHLEAVSHRLNVMRGESVSALNAVKSHCNHGHEFTPENTYLYRGSRHCRPCNRARVAASKARRIARSQSEVAS